MRELFRFGVFFKKSKKVPRKLPFPWPIYRGVFFSDPPRTLKTEYTFIRYRPFADVKASAVWNAAGTSKERAIEHLLKCRTDSGRAMKRRGDHDTSVRKGGPARTAGRLEPMEPKTIGRLMIFPIVPG